MSEITKLYESAGVKKLLYCDICNAQEHALGLCAETKCEPFYPPFTAEKQIAILQLLAQQCDLTISHFTEWEFIYYDGQEPLQITGKDFVETFAKLINAYWQDLTEQERIEIAEILKG